MYISDVALNRLSGIDVGRMTGRLCLTPATGTENTAMLATTMAVGEEDRCGSIADRLDAHLHR